MFFCPFKCKKRDKEDKRKPRGNLALRRLVEANLPVDITCDLHPRVGVVAYSTLEQRLVCAQCVKGANPYVQVVGKGIRETCIRMCALIRTRVEDLQECLGTMDLLVTG